jgi:hypothetical protein
MLPRLHFESMILFSLLFICGALADGPQPKVISAGKVVSLFGQVSVTPASAGTTVASPRALTPGDELNPGDQIQTGNPGSIKILLTDRTIIDLGPSSTFKLDQYNLKNGEDRTVEMSLSQGRLRNSVQTPVKHPGRFLIRTGAAIMGVRGTEFIVSATPSGTLGKSGTPQEIKTQVTVIHGMVEYTPQSDQSHTPIQLGEGKQLTTVNQISNDGRVVASANNPPPTVTRLQPAEVQTAAREGRVEDHTFHQAVVVENNQGPTGPGGPGKPNETGGPGGPGGPRKPNGPPPPGGPGRGGSILAAMDQSFAPPLPPPPPTFGNMGAPGTGVGFAPQGPRPPIGNPINVRVVFKK